jgi:DNA-binding transcriptional ArsR family regulator
VTVTTASNAEVAAALFHGFSERTRLSILLSLLDSEKRVVDLVEEIGGSQSNISVISPVLKTAVS